MEQNRQRLLDLWPLFFLLASLEAAVALLVLLRIPSEGDGFSLVRWATIGLLFVLFAVPAMAAFFAGREGTFRSRWLATESHPNLYKCLTAAFPFATAAIGVFAFWFRWWDPERLLSLFERAWPLLALLIAIGIQSTFWLLLLRFGIQQVEFQATKPALIAFVLLLLVFGFVSLTGLGLTPDPAYWGEPGVPLQGWQLGLVLVIGALFLPFNLLPFVKAHPRRTDFLVGALLWALAAGIWLSVPNEVLKNSFYFPIDPPANMPLPYSDSAYYDYMAHGLLTGVDYVEGGVPTRPLYIIFLTVLHLLFVENYNLIIAGQTLVLAAFPVVLYALAALLHSRTAGLVIALLAIFREWTNLLVSSDTRVSNTKMLLVDMPTLLLILLACLFAFRWLKKKERRSAFLAGGIFGLLLLLRTQAMFILPFLFLVAILSLRSEKRPWLLPLLIFLLGVAVSVAPWLTHNYLRIGKFTFDAPFQYQVLASQYAYTGNLDFSAVDLENKSLGQILVTFALKDPGFVAGFISNHFLATEVGAVLALPLIHLFHGFQAPINLYWTSFDGSLAWYNILLLVGYLALIAIGLGSAWRRWRWIGLLPLAFNLGYAAANGIGRFSGWRYDLPADWIAYFYFGVGFAEILLWLAGIFGFRFLDTTAHPFMHTCALGFRSGQAEGTENTDANRVARKLVKEIVPSAVAFAILGALPWIAESINPPVRYPDLDPSSLQSQISTQQAVVSMEEIESFANQPEAITLQGRLLYPRTFGGNAGLTSATPWPSYAPRDYPRLGFKLLNRDVREVVFPNKGVTVENVHARDVIALGCQRENYIEARLLVFTHPNLVYLSDLALAPCSQ